MKKIDRKKVNAICAGTYDLFSDLSDTEKAESRICAEIASTIISKRQSAGMSQVQLAEKLGVQQPMVSQLESGEYNYTISKITQLAAALDLDVKIVFSDKAAEPPIGSSKIVSLNDRASKYPIRRSSKNTSFLYTEIMEG